MSGLAAAVIVAREHLPGIEVYPQPQDSEDPRGGLRVVIFHPKDDRGGASFHHAWISRAMLEDTYAVGRSLSSIATRARAKLVDRHGRA